MAGAQVKVSALTADTTPTGDDLLLTVNDPAGTPGTRVTTVTQLGTYLASQLSLNSGWTSVTDSWAYASASTITIPSDGTTVYQKGVKIRFKQGAGYKYYIGQTVAATLLTVIVNADYTVANSAISDIAYSYAENPFGWPDWFTFTTTPTGWGGSPPATTLFRYRATARGMECHIRQTPAATSTTTTMSFTLPVAAATITNMVWASSNAVVENNSAGIATPGLLLIASAGTSVTCYIDMNATGWTNSGTKRLSAGNIIYEW